MIHIHTMIKCTVFYNLGTITYIYIYMYIYMYLLLMHMHIYTCDRRSQNLYCAQIDA